MTVNNKGRTTHLSMAQTPHNEFSGECSSDRLLVVQYGGDLYCRSQGHDLGRSHVMFTQVKYDEVRIAVERVLYTRNTYTVSQKKTVKIVFVITL